MGTELIKASPFGENPLDVRPTTNFRSSEFQTINGPMVAPMRSSAISDVAESGMGELRDHLISLSRRYLETTSTENRLVDDLASTLELLDEQQEMLINNGLALESRGDQMPNRQEWIKNIKHNRTKWMWAGANLEKNPARCDRMRARCTEGGNVPESRMGWYEGRRSDVSFPHQNAAQMAKDRHVAYQDWVKQAATSSKPTVSMDMDNRVTGESKRPDPSAPMKDPEKMPRRNIDQEISSASSHYDQFTLHPLRNGTAYYMEWNEGSRDHQNDRPKEAEDREQEIRKERDELPVDTDYTRQACAEILTSPENGSRPKHCIPEGGYRRTPKFDSGDYEDSRRILWYLAEANRQFGYSQLISKLAIDAEGKLEAITMQYPQSSRNYVEARSMR